MLSTFICGGFTDFSCLPTHGRQSRGRRRQARPRPDDPAVFPVVVPEVDSEIHRRHKAPVGPGKPTDTAVRPLFADGVFPRLQQLIKAALGHHGPDEQLYCTGHNGQQQADCGNDPEAWCSQHGRAQDRHHGQHTEHHALGHAAAVGGRILLFLPLHDASTP